MLEVVPATYKGPLVLLLLPHSLPLLLSLFPVKGLWHPATVTILSGPHPVQGREKLLVILS